MVRYVGLDVHPKEVEACILDGTGRVALRARVACTREALGAFARRQLARQDRVVLEATCNTWSVASLLRPYVADVVVSNPYKTRLIAHAKVKTDKVDAYVLAQLLKSGFLATVWAPPDDVLKRRRLVSRRSGLVSDRTVVKNRIHAILHQRLITAPFSDVFGVGGLEWLKKVPLDPEGREAVDSDLRLLETLDQEIEPMDEALAKEAYGDPRVKLLMTMPGVDVGVAMALLAAWGDISRFPEPDKAAAYLGLVPRVQGSGDKCYYGPITKEGRSHARWMLVQAAQKMDANPGPLGHFFRKLLRKKNRSVAVVATARKMAAIAWQMLTHNEPYRYALPVQTQMKLSRLRVVATGEKRPSGRPKGTKLPNFGSGIRTKTIPSLSEVYEKEGLPPTREFEKLTAAEQRGMQKMGVEVFARDIRKPHTVIITKEKAQKEP